MVLVVSAMFETCWITDTVLHFIVEKSISDEVFIAHTVMMFNSAVNPFVYALFSQRFREKMKEMLYRCPFLFRGRPAETAPSTRVLRQHPTPAAIEMLNASEKKIPDEVVRSLEISRA